MAVGTGVNVAMTMAGSGVDVSGAGVALAGAGVVVTAWEASELTAVAAEADGFTAAVETREIELVGVAGVLDLEHATPSARSSAPSSRETNRKTGRCVISKVAPQCLREASRGRAKRLASILAASAKRYARHEAVTGR